MPVSIHLIPKVAEAFRAYLASLNLATLSGYHYLRGMRTGTQKLPCVQVACPGFGPGSEAETSPLKTARVVVFVESRATFTVEHTSDASEDAHHEDVAAVLEALCPQGAQRNAEALRAFVNSENVTDRPVTAFWLGEIRDPAVQTGFDEERGTWLSAITFSEVPCINDDCDTAP